MQKIHEANAAFFDGLITPLEYRNQIIVALSQITDEDELERFSSYFIDYPQAKVQS